MSGCVETFLNNFFLLSFICRGNQDVRHGAFHVSQDVSVYLPFGTKKGYNFYFSWKGEAELPYVNKVSNEGLMGFGSVQGSNSVFKFGNEVNNHGFVFTLLRDGLKYDYEIDMV